VVSQLPADILLDNSMAMTAGASLSSVEQVTVTARVSLSGQPMAQSGDWQVQQHNVPTRGAPQQMLTISEQID
jgi:cytochrome c-type biogenesis protein CcmH